MGKHRWPTNGDPWVPPPRPQGGSSGSLGVGGQPRGGDVPRVSGGGTVPRVPGSGVDPERASLRDAVSGLGGVSGRGGAGRSYPPFEGDADGVPDEGFSGYSQENVYGNVDANPDPNRDEDDDEDGGAGGLQWRVARSAALVFLGIALAVGAALFLVRSSEPSAAAVSVQLDAERPAGSGAPDVGVQPSDQGDPSGAASEGGAREAGTPETTDGATSQQEGNGAGPGMSDLGTGEPPGGAERDADQKVIVYVTGAIAAPGVVEVAAGARLFEVIEQAGGALPEADLEGVNLAATPSDGQHIHVLAVGEEPRTDTARSGGSSPSGVLDQNIQPSEDSAGGAGGPEAPDQAIDINAATLADVESLPRVGPVLGQRIIDWREEHGPFVQASDIDAIPGIGPALLEGILPLIVVR
ncbi:ComEA family DNA-binding protein [Arthrobacter cheniae]|uniref:ComEA family DNA-binding protein n=1 Tax=Arthrobacter cheniae TaxID=1258888 RepID=A0A3A5MA57_9MICC|nr:ComEA family DNA-binding protein [Arthrobacter cheniae]RJT81881.1 ComEA family DNA-binding protein [Arthrobacter cheniae]